MLDTTIEKKNENWGQPPPEGRFPGKYAVSAKNRAIFGRDERQSRLKWVVCDVYTELSPPEKPPDMHLLQDWRLG